MPATREPGPGREHGRDHVQPDPTGPGQPLGLSTVPEDTPTASSVPPDGSPAGSWLLPAGLVEPPGGTLRPPAIPATGKKPVDLAGTPKSGPRAAEHRRGGVERGGRAQPARRYAFRRS